MWQTAWLVNSERNRHYKDIGDKIMSEQELEEKQKELFEVMKVLCRLMKEHPKIMKQRSIREVFENGICLFGIPAYQTQKTHYKYFSSDVDENTRLHYEHIVPLDVFIKYFITHIQEMSFEEFAEIIKCNCEVCGVSDEVNEKLNRFRHTMPDGWGGFNKGNKWQRYIDCGISVKDADGKCVKIEAN